ncbi:MAG: HD domain-containing protein [Candidatus Aenigmarchaeota archaeon]|nr:HD domain-containing protein [Candidatus Aenigmarchaeota archaeon]
MADKSIFDYEAVEAEVEKLMGNLSLIAHDIKHVRRVARGALFFARLAGGGRDYRTASYIAGLLHDLDRLPSEAKGHTDSSAEVVREFLKNYECHGLENDIVQMVISHSETRGPGGLFKRSVFVADKALEQMGAYVAFRAPIYVAEIEEATGKGTDQTIDLVYEIMTKRLSKFVPEVFPAQTRKLVRYQRSTILSFLDALKQRHRWAVNIAGHCIEATRSKSGKMDDIIGGYKSVGERDAQYKTETMRYLTERPDAFCMDLI